MSTCKNKKIGGPLFTKKRETPFPDSTPAFDHSTGPPFQNVDKILDVTTGGSWC